MSGEGRANLIAGRWCPAKSGATFLPPAKTGDDWRWPQSGPDDVAEALASARAAVERWGRERPRDRARSLRALSSALERDPILPETLARALGLSPAELAPHLEGLENALEGSPAREGTGEVRSTAAVAPRAAGQIALVAPDWRELARGALRAVAQELLEGSSVVLFSDPRLPVLAERLAAAALAAGLPHGVLSLLHGSPRELLGVALRSGPCALSAAASAERIVELRRLCEEHGIREPRLRALRCAALEIDPERALEESVELVIERAFGRVTTLSGQLPGQVARVFCPQRQHSRFTEILLDRLAKSAAARAPLAQIDREAEARVRAAWALGLDEGATQIFGGDEDARDAERVLPPTVFTNVEPYMASAKRQEPLPVLCLLRSGEVHAVRTQGGWHGGTSPDDRMRPRPA